MCKIKARSTESNDRAKFLSDVRPAFYAKDSMHWITKGVAFSSKFCLDFRTGHIVLLCFVCPFSPLQLDWCSSSSTFGQACPNDPNVSNCMQQQLSTLCLYRQNPRWSSSRPSHNESGKLCSFETSKRTAQQGPGPLPLSRKNV